MGCGCLLGTSLGGHKLSAGLGTQRHQSKEDGGGEGEGITTVCLCFKPETCSGLFFWYYSPFLKVDFPYKTR